MTLNVGKWLSCNVAALTHLIATVFTAVLGSTAQVSSQEWGEGVQYFLNLSIWKVNPGFKVSKPKHRQVLSWEIGRKIWALFHYELWKFKLWTWSRYEDFFFLIRGEYFFKALFKDEAEMSACGIFKKNRIESHVHVPPLYSCTVYETCILQHLRFLIAIIVSMINIYIVIFYYFYNQ